MMLVRRPFVLFDVDAVGLAALLALCGLGYVVGVQRMQAQFATRAQLTTQLSAARAALQRSRAQAEHVQQDTDRLRSAADVWRAAASSPGNPSQFVSRLAALVSASGMELLSAAPRSDLDPMPFVEGELTLTARGDGPSFVMFLDRLARETPYQAITQFSVKADPDPRSGRCNLTWTVRLFKTPGGSKADAG
jgi:hypothetical protein